MGYLSREHLPPRPLSEHTQGWLRGDRDSGMHELGLPRLRGEAC